MIFRITALMLLTLAGMLSTDAAHAALAAVPQALEFKERKATVLVFLYTDCPIANKMAPELKRLHDAFASKGVAFYRVYADADLSDEAIAEHGKDYSLDMPAVRDGELELVKLTGATVTPEAAVYDAEGNRQYRGRINNRYEELGKYRQQATEHDLRDAIEAVLAGKSPARAETRAVGCYLPKVDAEAAPEKEPRNHEE